MMPAKSFCRLLKPRRIKSAVGVAVGAAVMAAACLLAVCAPAARAGDTAPEWMRSAAAQTLPEYTKETSAVVLYDEKIIVVKENGDIEVTQRHVCKLLRADAKDECGYAVVHFDNETKVTAFRAWTIMASGGQMQVKDKEAAEVGLAGDFEVFSDKRAKIIKFPE